MGYRVLGVFFTFGFHGSGFRVIGFSCLSLGVQGLDRRVTGL